MNSKQYLILAGITLLYFLAVFLRSDMPGADAYGFVSSICFGKELPLGPPIATLFFNALPCSLILFKAISALFLFLSILAIAKTGELINPKQGWIAGALAFLSFTYVFQSFEFENDFLAYPFIFAALYFYLKWKIRQKERENVPMYDLEAVKDAMKGGIIPCLALLLFAGWGLWGGAIFYVLAFSIGSFVMFATSIPLLAVFWPNILGTLIPSMTINEQVPLMGFISLFFLLGGYFKLPKILRREAFIITIFGIVMSKYIVLLVPFLSIGLMCLAANLHDIKFFKQTILKKTLQITGILMLVIFLLGTAYTLFSFLPTEKEWVVVGEAVKYQREYGLPLHNDWGIGYWVEYAGGETQYKASFPQPDWNRSHDAIVVIQDWDKWDSHDCNQLKVFSGWSIWKC